MKQYNQCTIAKDLIPLYVEELTNEESTAFVKEHIKQCPECRFYYELIRKDYEQYQQKKPNQKQLDALLDKVAQYQQRIKLVGVLVAMLMSSIIVGAEVPFLSTLPFLIVTPFLSRLFYHKSLPIFLSAIPFGIIGGFLSSQNSSYIPFFTVITFLSAAVGVGAALLMKQGMKQLKPSLKGLYMTPAIVIFTFSCILFFSFYGNPIGYLDTMVKTKEYVNQNYEEGVLIFQGVGYNFKENRHYGKFEYILNGTRQVAPISIGRDGEADDYYKMVLEMKFSDERSADFRTEIAAAIQYVPVTIFAKPESELNITYDVLNERYYNLSYDLERRDLATKLRNSESEKLTYEVSFGAFSGEYDRLAKEDFLAKSVAILQSLKDRNIPFYQIELKAEDVNGNIQSIIFDKNTTEQELIRRYRTY